MKKLIALAAVVAIVFVVAIVPVSAKEVTYNLIDESNVWEKIDCQNGGTTGTIDYSYSDGKLVCTATTLWPSMTCTFDEPIPVKADSATVDFDVAVASGSTNVNITLTNGDTILLHQYIDDVTNMSVYDSGSGDYKGTAAREDMPFSSFKATVGVFQDTDLQEPDDAGYYYIESITVFAVYGSCTINKLTVTTEEIAVDVTDDSSEAPAASDEPASEKPSESTSDSGIAAAVVTLIVCIGAAVAVSKSRR
jgi:hypothetical protein